jgi:hypothetical protein
MKIYQIHHNHGRHIAYNQLEEKSNVENGWATVTKEEFYAGIIKDKPEEVKAEYKLSRNELIELYELKFGKKPAHNMKTENIQSKLDE